MSGGARSVALGILASKIVGLGRETAVALFFGVGPHADVWRSALRAPNLLQNLLGEQTLSAAFIPIYSRLVDKGSAEDAGRFAGAALGLLTVTVSVVVVLGMLFAPQIVAVLAAGFLGDAEKVAAGTLEVDRYQLLVRAVRIVFPMTGCLVISAWALGILNSHRRFLLPYLSPIVWNLAIVGSLVGVATSGGWLTSPAAAPVDVVTRWLYAACWGALAGGAAQVAVQLPAVLRLVPKLRPSFDLAAPGVRRALSALGPALAGRGVVQLSLYVDVFLASFLAPGAPSAIAYAATLINLPLGVFGMSVAAAELPELARRDAGSASGEIARRVRRGLRQSAFVVAPSVVGLLAFGFLVVGLLYRRGNFGVTDNWLVWAVLSAYALGLLASTMSRLLQNAFFALGDTKTPARVATVRLVASAGLGGFLMLPLDRLSVAATVGLPEPARPLFFGACGLALASSVAAWSELLLLARALRRALDDRGLGSSGEAGPVVPLAPIGAHLLRSLVVAAPVGLGWWGLAGLGPPFWAQGLVVLPAFAVVYLGWAWLRGAEELQLWLGRLG
ncbi:MAG: murein biosynthesis integral membrane protein MurJ [Acidobacteriota bacterium]